MPKYPAVKLAVDELAAIPDIQWARLAMAIDGEGSICILRCRSKRSHSTGYVNSTRHFLHVTVMNTDLRLLTWCRRTFGGGIYFTATGNGPFVKRKDCYAWAVSSGYAERIVRGCLPFFLIKKDQADIALGFQETFVGSYREKVVGEVCRVGAPRKLRPEIVERREFLKMKLSRVKCS